MNSSAHLSVRFVNSDFLSRSVASASRPFYLLLLKPWFLFLVALTAMLFRPPDVPFYSVDRIAFAMLIFFGLLRALLLRQSLRVTSPLTWPMAGLLGLALYDVLSQPFEAEAWSVLAAKWAVPFVLFHIAGLVFDNSDSLRRLEIFSLLVLAYLIAMALLFLCGAKAWIVPAFIVDDSIGIHADRARGPFLQAVANGVTLNLLGLIALDAFRRRHLPWLLGLTFLISLPLAILATKTRGVWLSFAASVLILMCFSLDVRVRRACLCLVLAGSLGLAMACSLREREASFTDRLQERSPVEFRMAVYQAGWEMFLQKPLSGWGFDGMQSELTRRISQFHQREYYFHNTFLEILVQFGLPGLMLYLWLVMQLFRLSRKRANASPNGSFLDENFRSLWPVLLLVYLLNASFVVMNYQFVNGWLFTLAGILAAQNRRAELNA